MIPEELEQELSTPERTPSPALYDLTDESVLQSEVNYNNPMVTSVEQRILLVFEDQVVRRSR